MSIFEEQAEFAKKRIPFAVCTVVDCKGSTPAKTGSKMIVSNAETAGTIGGAELEFSAIQTAREMIARKSAPATKSFPLFYKKDGGMDLACGGTVFVFIDVILPSPHVLLCGGGHVGLALSKIFDQLGYAYSVCDDRPDFRSGHRFPGARQLLDRLADSPKDFDYVIVINRGQDLDYSTLLQLHQMEFGGEILLIGSKAKWNDFKKRLEDDKIPEEFLDRVHCPAGLAMKTATVPEIALSMAGWIVDHYRLTIEATRETIKAAT